MHGEWRGVWRETGWPDGCAIDPPVAVAATPPVRTIPRAHVDQDTSNRVRLTNKPVMLA